MEIKNDLVSSSLLNHFVVLALIKAFDQPQAKQRLKTSRLYLACSGGRDSLSLAYACYLLHMMNILPSLPTILHVHHGWQTANDHWAELVSCWAKSHGFACQILKVNLKNKNENSARKLRYQALQSQMQAEDILLLGHHQEDQAETVLMRMIAGAGVQGLSAMKTWQKKQADKDWIWLWRPWIEVGRGQITQFAKQANLPFVDDITNKDDALMRGYLRTQVLPKLDKINPRACANMARTAQLCQQAFLAQQILFEQYKQMLKMSDYRFCRTLSLEQFFNLPQGLQSGFIHDWLLKDEIFAPSYDFSMRVLDLIHRRDNAHQSQLFWQGQNHAYMVCCYDGVLYCYHFKLWSDLQNPSLLKQQRATLQFMVGDFCAVCDLPHGINKTKINIILVNNQQKITIGNHSYRGKKLYQKLRLPVWLRQHLYLLVDEQGREFLVAPMLFWDLQLDNLKTQELSGVWRKLHFTVSA